MKDAGYLLIDQKDRRPGDIMVNLDYLKPPQAHIGVVLDNEGRTVLSNSSSRASFSTDNTPQEYNERYGRPGRFWRRPSPQQKVLKNGLEVKNQVTPSGTGLPPINAQVAINQTASHLRGIFLSLIHI